MYVGLLEAVLGDDADAASATQAPTRESGPLSEVVRLRHDMDKHTNQSDPGWAFRAVSVQLAYDAALVRWGRRRGITVDLDGFDVPERGRAQLEEVMMAKRVSALPPSTAGTVRSWPTD